jgi:uncharacterized coiled-coil DUF342 family protein
MTPKPQDPAIVMIAALMQETYALREQLAAMKQERDDLAAKAMRMDVDLIDAGGLIQTLEDRLAAAYRELDAWNKAADVLGPVGLPD